LTEGSIMVGGATCTRTLAVGMEFVCAIVADLGGTHDDRQDEITGLE
jgi:ABC-type uncharacterized transport system permease subunit